MSQTLTSQYGQDSLTVSDLIPVGPIRYWTGNRHVGLSEAEIEKQARALVAKSRAKHQPGRPEWTPEAEEEAVKVALWCHRENRLEYAYVMGGYVSGGAR